MSAWLAKEFNELYDLYDTLEALRLRTLVSPMLSSDEKIVYKKIYTADDKEVIIFANTARGIIIADTIDENKIDYYLKWSEPVSLIISTAKVYRDAMNDIYYTVFRDFDIAIFKYIKRSGWDIECVFEAINALMPGFKEIAEFVDLKSLINDAAEILDIEATKITLDDNIKLIIRLPSGAWSLIIKTMTDHGWVEEVIEWHYADAKKYDEKYGISEIVVNYLTEMLQKYRAVVTKLRDVITIFQLAGVR